jgi:hypothetical protein
VSDSDDLEDFVINIDKVVNSKKMMPTTRMLAMRLQRNPYTTIKDFLENLSDEELDTLLEVSDQGIDDSAGSVAEGKDRFSELVLMAEMLAKAEGLHTSTLEDMTNRTNTLMTFLACEGLARRGIVELWRENMSLGEDMGDKMIIRKIDTE